MCIVLLVQLLIFVRIFCFYCSIFYLLFLFIFLFFLIFLLILLNLLFFGSYLNFLIFPCIFSFLFLLPFIYILHFFKYKGKNYSFLLPTQKSNVHRLFSSFSYLISRRFAVYFFIFTLIAWNILTSKNCPYYSSFISSLTLSHSC